MNMNKSSFKLLALILLLVGLNACDGVTDLSPESSLTESNFYQTGEDMERALVGVYSRYQANYPRNWVLFETPTDHIHKSEYDFLNGLLQLDQIAFHPSNGSIQSFWQNHFNGVFRANALLQNLDTPENMPEADRARIEAEARFLRALFYFDLVRAFGGVPSVTDRLTIDEAKNLPRASEEEIYDLIISDLEFAHQTLPVPGGIETGRADRGAAAALLGKVHVYLEEYDTALTWFDEVEGYDYALLENFDEVYSLENEDHEEGVFTLKYIMNDNGHILSSDFLPYFGVEDYVDLGGQIADLSWELHQKFDEEDSRKAATITEYWRPPGTDGELQWRPYPSKFMVSPMIGRNGNGSGLDLHVIRFAEVLLLKAEALYFTGDLNGAADYINMIRERAYGNSDFNYTAADFTSDDAFIDILLLERSLELALENERWPDLVRLDKFIEVLSEIDRTQELTVTLNPQPHHRYFPIPEREMTESDALTQNPGYPE